MAKDPIEPAPDPAPVPDTDPLTPIRASLTSAHDALAHLGTQPGACYAFAHAKGLIGAALAVLVDPTKGP